VCEYVYLVPFVESDEEISLKDVLFSFFPHAPWTLLDLVTMQHKLQQIVNRDVDLNRKTGH
jgi:predicted nucleotidyltransferase